MSGKVISSVFWARSQIKSREESYAFHCLHTSELLSFFNYKSMGLKVGVFALPGNLSHHFQNQKSSIDKLRDFNLRPPSNMLPPPPPPPNYNQDSYFNGNAAIDLNRGGGGGEYAMDPMVDFEDEEDAFRPRGSSRIFLTAGTAANTTEVLRLSRGRGVNSARR